MRSRVKKKLLSRKQKLFILILIVVFLISTVVFYALRNQTDAREASAMSTPTLPLISLEACDTTVGQLHGYVNEMDACYMRDAIVPVGSDRNLVFAIDTFGADVSQIDYEIRSLDTSRKILDRQISDDDISVSGDTICAAITIDSLVDDSEEYILVIKPTVNGQTVYYYTRICITENCYERECLDFALYFHNTSLSDQYEELSQYLESTSETSTRDYSYVDIHSNILDVGFNGFTDFTTSEPVIEFKDISTSYNVIELYYQIYKGDAVYDVSEYYRVRYTADRIYLLGYSRSMNRITDVDSFTVSDQQINLGISSEDIDYMSNDLGTIVAFTESGSLYQYDSNLGRLSCVYTFLADDLTDGRASYENHSIKILSVEESGSMDFVVYGYMNCGSHEGMCGIDIFRYDSVSDTVEEQAFISTGSSYQILNASFNDMLYKSSDNKLYLTIQGSLLEIDLNTYEYTQALSGLSVRQFAVSGDSRYFAWVDALEVGQDMHILDLATGDVRDVSCEGGMIIPVTFIENDLVYGLVNADDIYTDAVGSYIYPMHDVMIVDVTTSDLDVIKDYAKDGYYVTDVTYSDGMLSFERVRKSGGGFTEAEIDTIKNSSLTVEADVRLSNSTDDDLGVEKVLIMSSAQIPESGVYTDRPVICNSPVNIAFAAADTADTEYYVYVGSRVLAATDDLQSAISLADENMGDVIDSQQAYIWKRGKKSYVTLTGFAGSGSGSTNLSIALDAVLEREGQSVNVDSLLDTMTPVEILRENLSDAKVLDLSGCTLSEVLYYVSAGHPVIAITGSHDAVLITGYDAANILVYRPSTKVVNKMGMNDAAAYFDSCGNCFISYVK